MNYFEKYQKYKYKYLKLKQKAGTLKNITNITNITNIDVNKINAHKKKLLLPSITEDYLEQFLPNKTNYLLTLSPENIKFCNITTKTEESFILPKIEMTCDKNDENNKLELHTLEFITSNSIILNSIGKGAYGIVYSISYNNILYTIKLPTSSDKELQEIKLYDKIYNTECLNFTNYKIFDIILNTGEKINGIIMPHASGNLDNIIELFKENDKLCRKVVKIIGNIITCFLKNRLLYLDIKPANILYICNGNNIHLYLGDLGSCIDLNNKTHIIYPPSSYFFIIASFEWPEFDLSNILLISKILAYIFVLLYLHLYNYDKYKNFFIMNPTYLFRFFNNFNEKLKDKTDIIFYQFFSIFKDYKLNNINANELFYTQFYTLNYLLKNLI
jgi:hypothetical protein